MMVPTTIAMACGRVMARLRVGFSFAFMSKHAPGSNVGLPQGLALLQSGGTLHGSLFPQGAWCIGDECPLATDHIANIFRRMRNQTVLAAVVLAALAMQVAPVAAQQETGSPMKKLTPVIVVDEIEPSLEFWVDRLGFEKTMEVPDGDRLGFVAVQAGGVEIMYQTRSSATADLPELAEGSLERSVVLFIEVTDLDAIRAKLEGVENVVPERTTDYGAREIWVRAPCGSVIGFAAFPEQ